MAKEVQSLIVPAFKIIQPIGEFFIGKIRAQDLVKITYADVRNIESGDREITTFMGIQRQLSQSRVKEIKQYINTVDASFPTSIILAIDGSCVEYKKTKNELILSEYIDDDDKKNNIPFNKIAKIIDGQHRIAGLLYKGDQSPYKDFELNIIIFVDIDLAEQAYIFSKVNLTQTKVNKSLVYDLYDFATLPSPIKTAHNIAVALDQQPKSPFYKKIMRLGTATEGRTGETISQATFVNSLMKYISKNEIDDRDILKRGGKLPLASKDELNKRMFRNLFIQGKDSDIAKIIWVYFEAIKEVWPIAWNRNPNEDANKGFMLNKTNGFKAFMRFLRPAYLYNVDRSKMNIGNIPNKQSFINIMLPIKNKIGDDDFNINNFKPGTGGESALYGKLTELSKISERYFCQQSL